MWLIGIEKEEKTILGMSEKIKMRKISHKKRNY